MTMVIVCKCIAAALRLNPMSSILTRDQAMYTLLLDEQPSRPAFGRMGRMQKPRTYGAVSVFGNT